MLGVPPPISLLPHLLTSPTQGGVLRKPSRELRLAFVPKC